MRWLPYLLLLALAMPVPALGLEYDVIAYHDVRDDVAGEYDADRYAISTEHLIAHFRWLRHSGFTPVSVDTILDAEAGLTTLPEKPVLLTFDDGLRSFYTRVFPLLKLFDYPAVVSVVSSWIETDGEVDYGGWARDRNDFLTWDQLRELQDSGLVDIASHTHALHEGIPGNPQGNLQPAGVTRRFASRTGATRMKPRIVDGSPQTWPRVSRRLPAKRDAHRESSPGPTVPSMRRFRRSPSCSACGSA
jgi:biofilm PGA synthesis lipoprotein PgaB